VKKSALKLILCLILISAGSIQGTMAQGKQKAPMAKVKLTDRISVNLPSDFVPMNDNDIARKYVSYRKPVAMYTSADGMIDFGLNYSANKWTGSNLKVLKDFYKASILSLYNEVVFTQETIKKINDQDFIVFEFVSEVKGDPNAVNYSGGVKKYTYIEYTIFDEVMLVFNFTAPAQVKDKWNSTAAEIMNSVKLIKAKK
jgi:hypothetical protein